MVYDDEVARQRRLLADSALAQIILQKPRYVKNAINFVSQAIGVYWIKKKLQFNDSTYAKIFEGSTKYLYSGTSFGGREHFTKKKQKKLAKNLDALKNLVNGWFETMQAAKDVPKVMNLHDHFLRLFIRILGPSDQPLSKEKGNEVAWGSSLEYARYKEAKNKIRPEWYNDINKRGRTGAVRAPNATSMPGLITLDFTIPISAPLDRCGLDLANLRLENHIRGSDRNMIDATRMLSEFKDVLGDLNLPFGASASGSTSTLFLSAITFSNLSSLEEKKQYLLACVAYLVGGGMHTCHEVFWTGRLLNIPYQNGKYLATLPKSFVGSLHYDKWSREFWDIVRPDRATVQ